MLWENGLAFRRPGDYCGLLICLKSRAQGCCKQMMYNYRYTIYVYILYIYIHICACVSHVIFAMIILRYSSFNDIVVFVYCEIYDCWYIYMFSLRIIFCMCLAYIMFLSVSACIGYIYMHAHVHIHFQLYSYRCTWVQIDDGIIYVYKYYANPIVSFHIQYWLSHHIHTYLGWWLWGTRRSRCKDFPHGTWHII